jgi:N-acetylmuramoyl-L-alanine amidase
MIVILDRGHGQKGKGDRFDPGVVAGKLREVDLTAAYIQAAVRALDAAGHVVHLLDTGTYDERHREALWIAKGAPQERGLYVQCHANAGGGKYGLIEHDARSSWGRTAAACLADALDELPEVPTARVWTLDSTQRGWSCIDGIYDSPTLTGVLYEPGFVDSVVHSTLWTPDGLERVGRALAEGVERYAAQLAARKVA